MFNKAVECDVNNVNALFSRGAVHNKLGNFQKAIDDYYLALEKDSNKTARKSVYKNLGKVLGLNSEVGESDRSLSHDQSSSNINNYSKNIENLNIDGDINSYVYSQLKDLTVDSNKLQNFKSGYIIPSTAGSNSNTQYNFKRDTKTNKKGSIDLDYKVLDTNSGTNGIKSIETVSYDNSSQKKLVKTVLTGGASGTKVENGSTTVYNNVEASDSISDNTHKFRTQNTKGLTVNLDTMNKRIINSHELMNPPSSQKFSMDKGIHSNKFFNVPESPTFSPMKPSRDKSSIQQNRIDLIDTNKSNFLENTGNITKFNLAHEEGGINKVDNYSDVENYSNNHSKKVKFGSNQSDILKEQDNSSNMSNKKKFESCKTMDVEKKSKGFI